MIQEYNLKDNSISFSIKNKEFNGITGKNSDNLIDILNLKRNYKGRIIIDEELLTKDKINFYKQKIAIIKLLNSKEIYQKTVYELMYYEIRRCLLSLKNPKKKMEDSLKIVGLNTKILERRITTLSSSEKVLVQLAIALLSNPNLLIMNDVFKTFDKETEKKTIMLLQKIRDQYNKTIVFVTNDSNFLYKYTTHLIIEKNNKILLEGETKDLFQRVDFLRKNKINIPEIVEFTYIAKKKKQVKIDYHKDVRDIIKDIYKHV